MKKPAVTNMEQLYNPVETKDAKFGEIIKASHIQFGHNNQFHKETTSQATFNGMAPDKNSAQEALETKADLRKAHFNFGNDNDGKQGFMTTN